jgi:5-formyltetrahydrofolate cyclo-ligase
MNKTRPPISDKYIVRVNVKQRISLLSEEEKNEASQLLCEKLLKLVIIQEAQNLIYYQAMGDEISLTPFIAVAQKE